MGPDYCAGLSRHQETFPLPLVKELMRTSGAHCRLEQLRRILAFIVFLVFGRPSCFVRLRSGGGGGGYSSFHLLFESGSDTICEDGVRLSGSVTTSKRPSLVSLFARY